MRKKIINLSNHLALAGLKPEASAVMALLKKARLDPGIEVTDRGDGRLCPDWYQQGFDPWTFIDQLINEYKSFIEKYNYREWILFLNNSNIKVAPWMEDNISWGLFDVDMLTEEGQETQRTADGGKGVASNVVFDTSGDIVRLSHLGFDEWIFNNEVSCMSIDSLASLVAHEVAHVALAHTRDWYGARWNHFAQNAGRAQAEARRAGVVVAPTEIPIKQVDGSYVMIDIRSVDELTLDSQDNEYEADLLGKALAEALGYRWGIYITSVKDEHKDAVLSNKIQYNEELLQQRKALTNAVESGGVAYSDSPRCVTQIQWSLGIPDPDGIFGPGTLAKWIDKVEWNQNEDLDVMRGLLPLDCNTASLMINRGQLLSHPPEEFRGAAMNLSSIKDDEARGIATNVVRIVEEGAREERLEELQRLNDELTARESERAIFGDNVGDDPEVLVQNRS